jgi:hypothetical protein
MRGMPSPLVRLAVVAVLVSLVGSACGPPKKNHALSTGQQVVKVVHATKQMPSLQTAASFCMAGIFKDAKDATVSKALDNVDPTGGEAIAWEGYTLQGDQATMKKELAGGQIISGTFDLGQIIYALIAATGEQVTKGTPEQIQFKLFGLIGPAAIYCAEAAWWLDGTVGGQLGTALQKRFLTFSVGQQLLAGRPSAISGDWVLYRRLTSCVNRTKGCHANPMKLRIACSGASCTIIRTNNAAGYPPWNHAVPLAFSNGGWRAHGGEDHAALCNNQPEPSRVSFILKTVSGGVVNGVWRAQQVKGTYKVVQGPDSCNNHTSSSGVYDLSTQPF